MTIYYVTGEDKFHYVGSPDFTRILIYATQNYIHQRLIKTMDIREFVGRLI